jgi:hypothetical protein
MSLLKCDVTGSTDRVEYLPLYMQTDKVKKVCFKVAIKMEQERLNPTVKETVKESLIVEKEEVMPKKKKGYKKKK